MHFEPTEFELVPPNLITQPPAPDDWITADNAQVGSLQPSKARTEDILRADMDRSDWFSLIHSTNLRNSPSPVAIPALSITSDLSLADSSQFQSTTVIQSMTELFNQASDDSKTESDIEPANPVADGLQELATDSEVEVEATDMPGGTINGDNSRIEFERGQDGKDHPKRIIHGDGTTTEYTWTKDGRVSEALTRAKGGRELVRISANEDGKYVIKLSTGQVYANLNGSIEVAENGTFTFTAKNHKWTSQPEGGITGDLTAGEDKFRLKVTEEWTQTSQQKGDKFVLKFALLKDGSELHFTHDQNQEINFVCHKTGSRTIEYQKVEGGWEKTVDGQKTQGTLTLRDGVVPDFRENAAADKGTEAPMSSDQLNNANYLQQNLITMLDSLWASKYSEAEQEVMQKIIAEEFARWQKEGKEPGPDGQRKLQAKIEEAVRTRQSELQKELTELKNQIQAENDKVRNASDVNEAWKDCPATRKAYETCVSWLQSKAVPQALQVVRSMSLDWQPGSPLTVPQEEGVFLIPERFRFKAGKGELKLDLRIDTTKAPDKETIDKLGRALHWINETKNFAAGERQKYELDTLLPSVIDKNRLPQEWLAEAKNDPDKLPALRKMIELTLKIRNYAAAIKTLKLDEAGIAQMPPLSDPKFANGKLESLNLDLPKNLDMGDPNTLSKVEAWTRWLDENGEKLDKAIEESRIFLVYQPHFEISTGKI
ncbi:MAG: hypothetical protein K2Z81_13115, partial [Cyanobacteria bacterium]|nr:hypothetical protein [Cyanobacteriota bacterium]